MGNARRILEAEVENSPVCAACGGKCCKFYPGITSPEDWGAPDKERMRKRIKAALDSGRYELDEWYGDPTGEKTGDDWFLVHMVRPSAHRRLGVGGDFERCGLLGPQGCYLPHADRPRQCRELEPGDPSGEHCGDRYSKRQAAIDWMPYQDVL